MCNSSYLSFEQSTTAQWSIICGCNNLCVDDKREDGDVCKLR